ncbi:MAG: hypothetical protein E7360_00645 [Clostridiales bacterium]|nr:hypothetical protein [Clostridiales bacterium]
MNKRIKNLVKGLSVCLIAIAVCLASVGFNGQTAKADNVLTLKKGNYAKWIDRVNFGEYKEMARSFYEWLEENTDNDGVDDALINPTDAELFEIKDGYGNPTGKVQYVYTFNVFEEEVTYSGNNPNSVISPIAQKNMEISQEVMTTAYAAFNRDNPQVFWLTGLVNFGDFYEIFQTGNTTFKYTQKVMFIIKSSAENYDLRADFFATENSIRTAISTMNDKVAEIIGGLPKGASDYEKVKHFNDYLVNNNCYRKGDIKPQSYISYFAILGRSGDSIEAPVCEGYARSFKVLCDNAGVECILEDGDAGEPHMWNVVKIDGVWYNTDVTWNDPTSSKTDKVSGSERDDYLLVGSDTKIFGYTFASKHVTENTAYQGIIGFTNGPKISATAYESDIINSWNVSSVTGTDSVTAILFKTEDYTDSAPEYELVFSGKGKMKDFSLGSMPWSGYADNVVSVTVREGVDYIGNYAFYGLDGLTQIVIDGYSVEGADNTFIDVGVDTVIKVHDSCPIVTDLGQNGMQVESLCEYRWSQKSEATCTQAEVLKGVCVCGSEQEKEGEPKVDHTFDGEYEYTDDGHWRSCDCGEKGNLENHIYGVWMVNKQPTYTEKGERTKTCACGHAVTEEIDMLVEESTPESEESSSGESVGDSKESESEKKGLVKIFNCKSSVGGVGCLGFLSLAVGAFIIRKRKD